MKVSRTRGAAAGVLAAASITATVLGTAGPALADQHGTNYCVSGVFAVHQSASLDSAVVGNIARSEVWHHYNGVGNWSLGYVRGDSEVRRGYIPLGALTQDLGNSSGATVCPY